MSETPSNLDDVIDSRDVIFHIERLTRKFRGATTTPEPHGYDRFLAEAWHDGLNDTDADDLASLLRFEWEATTEAPAGWEDGITFIADFYFEDYAKELAWDIGALRDGQGWPLNHIDWESAAEDLKQDFTALDFDGTTYYAIY